MKRLWLILLALTLLLTGCGEPDSTPGEGVGSGTLSLNY